MTKNESSRKSPAIIAICGTPGQQAGLLLVGSGQAMLM